MTPFEKFWNNQLGHIPNQLLSQQSLNVIKRLAARAFEAGREQGWNESNQMQKESE